MAELRVAFRFPGLARAVFVSDYGLRGGRLLVDDAIVLDAASAEALAAGVSATLGGRVVTLRAQDPTDVRVFFDGIEAPREDRLRAPPTRSAWIHGWLALAGSLFGFAASWLYFLRAEAGADAWAMKMSVHTAAWHLLLTLTLFPASVWGQRPGIRAVQAVSILFFLIHLGMALANTSTTEGPWLMLFNASSGLAFLAAALYGQRAHRDMDPLRPPPRRLV
jgi:hypothetical protein